MAKEIVTAPLSGKIISVEVRVGDTVNEDTVLCVLESMKMENPILALVKGKVVEVGVKPDQTVDAGDMLAVIEY